MTLSPETQEILEDKLEEHAQKAQDAAGDEPKVSAAHYSKAAEIHERLAEAKESPVVSKAHENKAETFQSNSHAQLREAGLVPDDAESEGDAGADSGLIDNTGSPGAGSDDGSGDDAVAADQDISESEYFEAPPSLSLDDVGGLEDEIERIHDGLIKPNRYPEVYEEIGVNMSNGVLLHGPPGTGKSMIARAVANALDRPYAELSAADLGSEYVNKGAQNIAQLFEEARAHQPCVLFIDELDSLARSRSGGSEQTDGSRQMITQLLQELDQIQGSEICVISATNLLDDIDGAIKRSGRFDRKIRIGAPNAEDRRDILQIHLEDKKVEGSIDLDRLVEWTEGFSGADLASLVEQAGQTAASDSIDEGRTEPEEIEGVTQDDLLEQAKTMEPGIKQWEEENSPGLV